MSNLNDWRRIASLSQLRDDEAFPAKLGETSIALYRLNGRIYALDDVCTHEYALLSQGFIEGCAIECPLYQAKFDIITGKCLAAPATTDLNCYAVRIDGDEVYVSLASSCSPGVEPHLAISCALHVRCGSNASL